MKLSLFLVAVSILFYAKFSTAQSDPYPLLYTGVGERGAITLHGVKLKSKQLKEMLGKNQHCYQYVETAQGALFAGTIFNCVGGFFAGYFVGGAVIQSETHTVAGIIGGSGIIVGTIFNAIYRKNLRQAVRVYNATATEVFGLQQMEWKVGSTQHGVGLVVEF